MANKNVMDEALIDLLYQTLETEQGGVKIYEQAIDCAINDDLRAEWKEYLDETQRHVEVVLAIFKAVGLDPHQNTPGRDVVSGIGEALVVAMKKAKRTASPEQAQLVASECVVLAETKDHANWELLAHLVKHGKGPIRTLLKQAVEEVEQQEDHHLFHTKGWSRELWLQTLGFDPVLPPPEEIRNVESAIGASRAQQARAEYL